MSKLTEEQQQNVDIKKLKKDLKEQKSSIEKIEKRIATIVNNHKLKPKK